MTVAKLAPPLMAAILLAGCSDNFGKAGFETLPETLETDQGPVVCQFYTEKRVLWDEAVGHPETMTKEEADAVCLAEGKRRQDILNGRDKPKPEKRGLFGSIFGKKVSDDPSV